MQKKKNDVKARTTLLLSLHDEHQLRFSKYKTARELWAAILKTFGGNEATKKTKKNLLKQQYGNFRAKGSETLEQTFTRLQVIVGQLQFMDVEVEQDDLNQKFLTILAPECKYKTAQELWAAILKTFGGNKATKKTKKNLLKQQYVNFKAEGSETLEQTFNRLLAPEWLMHTIVRRNRSDLDTMSLDDLYNHLKDINQIDKDDMEEIDIKWNMALLSMRADRFWKKIRKKISIQGTDVAGFDKLKVECFNYHKMGHFARECRAPRNQDKGRKDNYRQGSKVKEQAPKALMAIDGVG
nr:hypothetical protein [Tanacetum cinerariifolium]